MRLYDPSKTVPSEGDLAVKDNYVAINGVY